MIIYTLDWSDQYEGAMRAHFSSKQAAMKFFRDGVNNDIFFGHVILQKRTVRQTKEHILEMLDAAANLGNNGPTGYPGKSEVILEHDSFDEHSLDNLGIKRVTTRCNKCGIVLTNSHGVRKERSNFDYRLETKPPTKWITYAWCDECYYEAQKERGIL